LRIVAAALKVCTGIVAVCWAAAGIAAPAGTASSVAPQEAVVPAGTPPPSIRVLAKQTGLAGTCGGAAFNVSTFITVTPQSSADVKVSAPGVGTIEEFTDETGKNIGAYNAAYPTFHILPFGGGLAPNTLITITITTYSGPALTGSVTFVSTLVFNCTTGQVIRAPAGASATPVPALSSVGLVATAALLLLVGAVLLRRSARPRRARR
jgi:hypothetical protein